MPSGLDWWSCGVLVLEQFLIVEKLLYFLVVFLIEHKIFYAESNGFL